MNYSNLDRNKILYIKKIYKIFCDCELIKSFQLILSLYFLVLLSSNFVTCYAQQDSIICPNLENPVTLDGKITNSDEWKDAMEVSIPSHITEYNPNEGTVFVSLKKDSDWLYVLIDAIGDTKPGRVGTGFQGDWDYYGLAIDDKQDKGIAPKADDTLYVVRWYQTPPGIWKIIGNETSWDFLKANKYGNIVWSTDASNNEKSDKPHIMIEYKIPLSSSSKVGFHIIATDSQGKTDNNWPEKSDYMYPNSWGTLILSEPTPTATQTPTETPIETPTTQTPTPTETLTTTPTETPTSTPTTSPTQQVTQTTGFDMNTIGIVVVIIIVIAIVAFFFTKRKKS